MHQWLALGWLLTGVQAPIILGVSALRTAVIATQPLVSSCFLGLPSSLQTCGHPFAFHRRLGPNTSKPLFQRKSRALFQTMAAVSISSNGRKLTLAELQQLAQSAREKGWPSADVRELYQAFFESQEHLRYPSSPVVPHGDNTLLFINAGGLRGADNCRWRSPIGSSYGTGRRRWGGKKGGLQKKGQRKKFGESKGGRREDATKLGLVVNVFVYSECMQVEKYR